MDKEELEKLWLKFNRMHRDLRWVSYSFSGEADLKKKTEAVEKLIGEISGELRKRIENS